MKKILLINGHPVTESFSTAILESYKKGAIQSGAEIKEIKICELNFNPNLKYGYKKRLDLEEDLKTSIEKIIWAEHLVWIHPVWWGGLPAVTKGFIDRVFLPDITFRYKENSVWWEKLLKGKTARIITTLDQPGWFYNIFFKKPSINQLKKCTLEFCGIKPVKVTFIGPIKNSKEEFRINWLKKINKLGIKNL